MARDEESGENCLRVIVRDGLKFYNPVENYRVLIGQSKHVWLRASVNRLTLELSYSLDGERFEKICKPLDSSNLCDEAYGVIGHEGHTGTFIGMACQDLTGEKKHADFLSFEYIAEE